MKALNKLLKFETYDWLIFLHLCPFIAIDKNSCAVKITLCSYFRLLVLYFDYGIDYKENKLKYFNLSF